MPELSATPIANFLSALSDRTPTPGGGAAAAVTAAIGASLGAMAARYTTGKRWVDREEDARVLGDRLASLSASLSKLAQEDIDAYSALSAAKIAAKTQPSIDLRPFEAAAAMVPLEVLRLICTAVQDLAAFRPRCNPHLVVDLNSAVFLMAGAARAAAVLVRGNGPNAKILDEVSQRIAIIGRSETL